MLSILEPSGGTGLRSQEDKRPEACRPASTAHPRPHPNARLRLEFRKARLDTVLDHFRSSGGIIIHAKPNVATERSVNLTCDQPVSTAEALSLLKRALVEMGCTLIQKGGLFVVIKSQDVKKHFVPLPAI
jgi:hypothetical protein